MHGRKRQTSVEREARRARNLERVAAYDALQVRRARDATRRTRAVGKEGD